LGLAPASSEQEYQVDIQFDKGMSEAQKYRIVADKVKADIALMPELYADYELRRSGYVDAKARLVVLQKDFSESLPDHENLYVSESMDLVHLPTRAASRLNAFAIQEQADRRDWAENRILDMVQIRPSESSAVADTTENKSPNEDITDRLNQARENRPAAKTAEARTPWNELPEDGENSRKAEVNKHIGELRSQINSSHGEEAARAFDNLDEDRKNSLVEDLIQREFATSDAYFNLRQTAMEEVDAVEIMQRLNEARSARLRVREGLNTIKSEVVRRRAENSLDDLVEASRRLSRGQHLPTDAEVVPVLVETGRAVLSRVDARLWQPVSENLVNALDTAVRTGYFNTRSQCSN